MSHDWWTSNLDVSYCNKTVLSITAASLHFTHTQRERERANLRIKHFIGCSLDLGDSIYNYKWILEPGEGRRLWMTAVSLYTAVCDVYWFAVKNKVVTVAYRRISKNNCRIKFTGCLRLPQTYFFNRWHCWNSVPTSFSMGRATSKGNEAKSKMKHPSDMPTPRFEHGW